MLLEKKKNIVLNFIGILFIMLGSSAVINTLLTGNPEIVFWFCYSGLILIGVGVLRRDGFLMGSQMNILLIPLIFWTVDFIFGVINGYTLLGIVDYYFIPGPIIGKIISSQHLFTVPLSLYALFLIKLKRKDSWKISFIQLIIIFFVSLLLTSPENNVNCVYSSCMDVTFGTYYPLTWFILTFSLVFLTSFIINRIRFLQKD